MPQEEGFLSNIYSVEGSENLRDYYDQWADSYDSELAQSDYRTPQRCAQALARYLSDPDAPVLDFACGTGLSGVALYAAGFRVIDGMDISAGMLAQARAKGVYRKLVQPAPDAVLDARGQGYAAIVASGAISPGAAPPENIDGALDSLAQGGLLVISLNDHALDEGGYKERLDAAVAAGGAERLEAARGPHLPALGLQSTVFVLRKV
ncbi:class I SAM-dependent DNA methyltransferase [Alkalilacustris brevis]|uniref:class I SAM-dependent DNA methyltransferase n=1 Tax=Alkalilacustris brevis TaxID=2026338 RepID=UPI000E0D756F|nr:methyltransferase domain-containing protein [Alkalilacustris brevis]